MSSLFCIISILFFTPFGECVPVDTDPTAKEIVQKADEKLRGLSSEATLSMQIVRPDWNRTIEMKTWAVGEDYSLMLITAPARDKGTAILKREKEIWNWQPTIERVIKLPPSMMMQSWMGSDFTNDDLVKQSSIVVDYTHALAGEEEIDGLNCWVVELTPKEDAAVVWGKIKMWIDQSEYLQLKVEFYDEDDFLINTMHGKDVKELGGRTITTTMELIPAEKEGHTTILQYQDIKFDVKIDPNFFSVQNMKRVR